MTHKLARGPRPYYYFAYGSNLNIRQMIHRCPKAKPVCRYTLEGFRLVFRGVADVVEDENSVVHGALWRITDECERSLNKYEGYRVSQLGLYVKRHLVDGDKRIMFYVMNPYRGLKINPPSPTYYGTIMEGYDDFRISRWPLIKSVKRAWKTKRERDRRNQKFQVAMDQAHERKLSSVDSSLPTTL